MDIGDLERAAAEHWQAPDTERLGGWLLRAAAGFTGRANSALPAGDPGLPLPEAVTAVEAWYRRRGLPPMIVVAGALGPRRAGALGPCRAGVPDEAAAPHPLETLLAERAWCPRPDPAFVMTADMTGIPRTAQDVQVDPEPDEAWLGLYRYRGQELPPIATTLMLSAPWQAFGSIRRDGRTVAVGRVSVAGEWGALTAVEVAASAQRQGLGGAITAGLCAAAAARGARRMLLQVAAGNTGARALYARYGFRDSHRYHYLIAPPAADGERHAGRVVQGGTASSLPW